MTTKQKGADGLTERERAFVALRRADPAAPGHEIARLAGFKGDLKVLKERARVICKKPAVALAITAPRTEPREEVTDEQLRKEIRARLYTILKSQRASDSDAIKAADKLLATIPGGFVPVQLKTEGTFTLESWVARMGGAPPELPALQPKGASDEQEHGQL